MTTNYLTIMMKHFEHMNIEVAAAAETILNATSLKDREDVYDCNRFLFVKEGEGKLIVQDKEIPLAKGMFCVLLSGMSHRIALDPDEELTLQWCHFRASYEDRDLYRTLKIPFHISIRDEQATSAHFGRLFEELAQDKLTSRLRIKAIMLELISDYLDNLPIMTKDGAPTEDLQKIDMVLKYIDDHLADNITVENLAKQVYLHPNYFIVFFKGILGYSPIQYVNQRRMETAKSLLLQPECNVSAVAGKVGMQIYYFSRMFKAHTGLTPSRYRKQSATFVAAGNLSSEGEGKQK
ncbi:AraC family transcriptional regulator [Cohnella silvisoli]|uniref:AraC family transcriptional regulator n=1 Tax=Cohnella silvisoli TaxID=2873699 RepID=A0ABV1KR65_9BACL|nr:AraC family transcriptional regulator [Cohnella silvisoli]MCD9024523.1 AraC family transcriptional regulator [Cohnella silvisoli]